ncbi:MAG: C69 family dipeptidase [Bacteroidota bacterium]
MCDTFIALPKVTEDRTIIFAKNSDREANEAQSLEYHSPKRYTDQSKVKCTYIEIPQIEKTNGIIISRPFWMWGAEMGVNEHGVVIGNEAVFTKIKVKKKGVLTGMDLLRLALERADTARKAKQVIIDLLNEYGQGGVCGYEDKGMFYHNSFIIADKEEAWVLETAGEFWVTKKVKEFYAISNGLTIGSDYDEIHPNAIKYAQKRKWIKGEFNFALAFSDFLYTTFSACKKRKSRADEILENSLKKINIQSAFAHLRDHNSDKYNPSKAVLGNTICAHAGNSITRNASQTTASLIVHLTKEKPIIWVTATSTPCISIFKPIWFDAKVVPNLGEELGALYNAKSFWWKHEMLHREILKDYKNRIKIIEKERNEVEDMFMNLVYTQNNKGIEISKITFEKHLQLIEKWIENVRKSGNKNSSNIIYKNYWKKLNNKVKLTL